MVACLKAKFSDPILNIFIFLWQSFMSDRWHIQVSINMHKYIQTFPCYITIKKWKANAKYLGRSTIANSRQYYNQSSKSSDTSYFLICKYWLIGNCIIQMKNIFALCYKKIQTDWKFQLFSMVDFLCTSNIQEVSRRIMQNLLYGIGKLSKIM
jgi:hypothetical protein